MRGLLFVMRLGVTIMVRGSLGSCLTLLSNSKIRGGEIGRCAFADHSFRAVPSFLNNVEYSFFFVFFSPSGEAPGGDSHHHQA